MAIRTRQSSGAAHENDVGAEPAQRIILLARFFRRPTVRSSVGRVNRSTSVFCAEELRSGRGNWTANLPVAGDDEAAAIHAQALPEVNDRRRTRFLDDEGP